MIKDKDNLLSSPNREKISGIDFALDGFDKIFAEAKTPAVSEGNQMMLTTTNKTGLEVDAAVSK